MSSLLKVPDTPHKMGKLIDRFNRKVAPIVSEIFNYAPEDDEGDFEKLQQVVERLKRKEVYLKGQYEIVVEAVVRPEGETPFVRTHLKPLTNLARAMEVTAQEHLIKTNQTAMDHPLTVDFYFAPPE